MSLPLLAAPAPQPADDERRRADAEDSQANARAQRSSQGTANHRQVASAEDCLAALSRLPSLIVMGLLKPYQANAIRGVYAEILSHYERQGPADCGGVADDALIDMLTR
jgi:hypothetical protein